jgi:hypothetical protein
MTAGEHPITQLYHRKVDFGVLGDQLLSVLHEPLARLPIRLQVDGYRMCSIPTGTQRSGQLGCGGFIPWSAFQSRKGLLQWTIPIAQELRRQIGEPLRFSSPEIRIPQGVDHAERIHDTQRTLRLVLNRIPATPECPFWQKARLGKYYDVSRDEFIVAGLLPALRLDVLHPNGLGLMGRSTDAASPFALALPS